MPCRIGLRGDYPFGVVGVILSMLALRLFFRWTWPGGAGLWPLSRRASCLGWHGPTWRSATPTWPEWRSRGAHARHSGVVVSRIYQGGVLQVPKPETALKLATCCSPWTSRRPGQPAHRGGRESDVDLTALPSRISSRRVIVTGGGSGAHLARAGLPRASVCRSPCGRPSGDGHSPGFELQIGDTVLAVGEPEDIDRVSTELGDAPRV